MSDSHGLSSGESFSPDAEYSDPGYSNPNYSADLDPSKLDPSKLGSLEADQTLRELEQDINRLQRTIRLTIQAKLRQFAGVAFDSISENQALVDSIAKLLDSHALRVRCSECGHPAILRVSPRGKSHGVFVFDHTIDGRRTFHGGKSCMPEVFLVAKPPRKKTPRKTGASDKSGENERSKGQKRGSDQSESPEQLAKPSSAKK